MAGGPQGLSTTSTGGVQPLKAPLPTCGCRARGKAPPIQRQATRARRREVAVDVDHQVGVVGGIDGDRRRPCPPARWPHWPRWCPSEHSAWKPAAGSVPSATPSDSPAGWPPGHRGEVQASRPRSALEGMPHGARQHREVARRRLADDGTAQAPAECGARISTRHGVSG